MTSEQLSLLPTSRDDRRAPLGRPELAARGVRQLLGLADETHCAEMRELAQQKLNAVRTKLKDLRAMEQVLSELVAQCGVNTKHRGCPIIERLGKL